MLRAVRVLLACLVTLAIGASLQATPFTFSPHRVVVMTPYYADTNYNTEGGYSGNGVEHENRSLLHFDVSSLASQLTPGVTVSSITLTVPAHSPRA